MRSDLIEVAVAQLGYCICLPLWQGWLKADVATLQASQGQGYDHSAPLKGLACRFQSGAFTTRRSDEGQPQVAVSPPVSSSWYKKCAVQHMSVAGQCLGSGYGSELSRWKALIRQVCRPHRQLW